jgi:lipid-binding SYLF domain-containing protein
MKVHSLLFAATLSLSLLAGAAFAQDKAAKQAEVLKTTDAALQKFYAKKPELKAAVAKAPGYGVFTTYGISFLVGGSGGAGVLHDNVTHKKIFMKMGGASVGAQIGASQSEVLIVFKTAAAMHSFVDKGWTASGSATASAGAGSKSAGGGVAGTGMEDADTYTYTKTGLEAGIAIGGSKFWKDDELN